MKRQNVRVVLKLMLLVLLVSIGVSACQFGQEANQAKPVDHSRITNLSSTSKFIEVPAGHWIVILVDPGPDGLIEVVTEPDTLVAAVIVIDRNITTVSFHDAEEHK